MSTCWYCEQPIAGVVTRVGTDAHGVVDAHYACWQRGWQRGVNARHRARSEHAHDTAAAIHRRIHAHRGPGVEVLCDALAVAVEALLVDAGPHDLSGAQIALGRIRDLLDGTAPTGARS